MYKNAADIAEGDWIDRFVPLYFRPYFRLARIDRPIGIWLLLFPCWWSLVLATPKGEMPNGKLLVLFLLGAILMRGAGCTINDIVDRKIDAKVARTATRPLASGDLSLKEALLFLALQLGLGLAILIEMGSFATILGMASLILIVAYPFMKRVTWWPQAFLGLTFNWGALLGWAAIRGTFDWPALFLYVAGIFWTLSYDTIYAHQDKIDDASLGVKSTAIKLGTATKTWLLGFDFLAIVFFTVAFASAHLSWVAYVGLGLSAWHLVWQAMKVDLDNPKDCLLKFRSNQTIGWIILTAIFLGQSWI